MIKVTLVGQGNVSYHLAKAFRLCREVELLAILNSREKLPQDLIESGQVCIIAVSDAAIHEVSQKLKQVKCLLAHTSGSIPLSALPTRVSKGVFYPLQTFSKERKIDFSNIPICIEAENEKDVRMLKVLGESISNDVREVSSSQRKSLHLAAVFSNNFINHLYHISNEICVKNNLPFDMLMPLIAETANKIKGLTPLEAQTGPARRKDSETIKEHLDLLKGSRHKEIYSVLTDSIEKTYGKKL